jgi:hypothetical protein
MIYFPIEMLGWFLDLKAEGLSPMRLRKMGKSEFLMKWKKAHRDSWQHNQCDPGIVDN